MERYETAIKKSVAGTYSCAFPRRVIGIFRAPGKFAIVIFSAENDICAATCARH